MDKKEQKRISKVGQDWDSRITERMKSKFKPEIATYSREELMNLNEDQLFGLFCYVQVDPIELPTPGHFATVIQSFKMLGRFQVVDYLEAEQIHRGNFDEYEPTVVLRLSQILDKESNDE